MKTGPMLIRPPSDFVISALDDRLMFIVLTMVVVGLVTVLNVHKLLADDRERSILHVLPVSPILFVFTRIAAHSSFVLLFFVDFNLISSFLYPVTSAPVTADAAAVVRLIFAHLLTISIASLFTFAFFTGLYSLLAVALPRLFWRRVSSFFQLASVSGLVSFLFAGLLSVRQLVYSPAIAQFNPAIWFLGVYQMSLHESDLSLIIQKKQFALHFAEFAITAKIATLATVLVGTVLIFWALVSETDSEHAASPAENSWFLGYISRMAAGALCAPGLARAVFGFCMLTVLRVSEYQILLAAYIGIGVGLILNEIAEFGSRSSLLFTAPLVLSFVLLTGLTAIVRIPVDLGANWIFQIGPDHEAASASTGLRTVILTCGLLPVLLMLVPVHIYLLGFSSALLFFVYCWLLGVLLLEALTWQFSFIPFAREQTVSNTNLPFWFTAYALGLAIYSKVFGALSHWIFGSIGRGVAGDIILAIVCYGVIRYKTKRTTGRQVAFEEPDFDAVQLLNL
jgi:hypothetical protein